MISRNQKEHSLVCLGETQTLKKHMLLQLDRLRTIIEHGQLSERELTSLTAGINELYERHILLTPPVTAEPVGEQV